MMTRPPIVIVPERPWAVSFAPIWLVTAPLPVPDVPVNPIQLAEAVAVQPTALAAVWRAGGSEREVDMVLAADPPGPTTDTRAS